MRALIFFAVVFVAAIAAAIIEADAGYVLVSIYGINIVTSFWAAICLSILAAFVCALLYRALFGVWDKGRRYSRKRNEKRSQAGLLKFVEGDWLGAKKELAEVKSPNSKRGEKSFLHSLIAARTALDLGLLDDSDKLLQQAAKAEDKNNVALAINQARLLLAKKAYSDAKQCLEGLTAKEQKHPSVLDLKRQVYIHMHDWPALLTLLPRLKSSGMYTDEAFRALEENTYMSYMDSIVQAATISPVASMPKQDAQTNLQNAWNSLPKHIKTSTRVLGLYCTLLHRVGDDERVEILIRKSLKNEWHGSLVELYGVVKSKDPVAQLGHAEKWLSAHQDDAQLLLCCARLSVRNELWGKAKEYFERSLHIYKRPEAFAELAALLDKLGEKEKSQALYKQGLSAAIQM